MAAMIAVEEALDQMRGGVVGIGGPYPVMPFVIGKLEDANCDDLAFAGAERADDREVRSACEVDVVPSAGVGVASGCGADTVEEGFDDPGVAADRCAAEAVVPPAIVLDVVDAADGDGADAQGIIPAHEGRGEVLAEHGIDLSGMRRWPAQALPVRSVSR